MKARSSLTTPKKALTKKEKKKLKERKREMKGLFPDPPAPLPELGEAEMEEDSEENLFTKFSSVQWRNEL
jgi:hypothetical protein